MVITALPLLIPLCVDRKTRVKWWEPYRETLRSGLTDLRAAGVLRTAFWLRVVTASAVVIGIVIAAMSIAYPGMWLPWPQIISGLVIWPAAIALLMALTILAPRHVEVRTQWIQFTHGQSAVRIRAQDIRSITVEEREDGGLRLRLDYTTRRGVRRTRECAVARAVCRETLATLVAHLAREVSAHAAPPVASDL
jgi:hypothetical protein